MRKIWFLLGMGCWLLLTACQPQVMEVEVTRVVDTSAVTDVIPATPETILIEVTRLVPQEVTRVVSEEVIVEQTPSPVGSAARPVQLLFAPTVNTAVLTQRAQSLIQALSDATGARFEIGILDDEQAVIDLLCAAPADTIAFLSGMGYARANEQCGAEVTAVGVNNTGQSWQTGMIIVRQDSGIESLADLAGKTWAVPDETSVPETRYFQALLVAEGVEPGNMTVVPGDNTAMLAVLNGDVDFASGRFIPPVMPYEETEWIYGEDDPELWRATGILPGRSAIGFIIVNGGPDYGGYMVRDARSGIYDTNRTVFQDTKILILTAPIPNQTIAFGANFPVGLARQVMVILDEFGDSETCRESLCASDVYGWSGIDLAVDADYEPYRFVLETLNYD
ncbi:MAG: PhnD/SsuA/transferrin family substrate-binding protein [Chloroflexi bacterium]|nr:PhnD/SsuA/transferrin family substrate-binding protein [Chloroflexota bacterium]